MIMAQLKIMVWYAGGIIWWQNLNAVLTTVHVLCLKGKYSSHEHLKSIVLYYHIVLEIENSKTIL